MIKAQICRYCGKPIRFVRRKGTDQSVPVDPQRLYFIPSVDGDTFYLTNGNKQTGRPASDGICGFQAHNCPRKPMRSILSENELARRRYY